MGTGSKAQSHTEVCINRAHWKGSEDVLHPGGQTYHQPTKIDATTYVLANNFWNAFDLQSFNTQYT